MLPLHLTDGTARIVGAAPIGALGATPATAIGATPTPDDGASKPSRFAEVLRRQSAPTPAKPATPTAAAGTAPRTEGKAEEASPTTDADGSENPTPAEAASRPGSDAKLVDRNADAAKTRNRLTGCVRTPTAPTAAETAPETAGDRTEAGTDPQAGVTDPAALPSALPADRLPSIKGEAVRLVPIKLDSAAAGDAAGADHGTNTAPPTDASAVVPRGEARDDIGRRVAGRGLQAEASATPAAQAIAEASNGFARTLAEAGAGSRRAERAEPVATATPLTASSTPSSEGAGPVSASVPMPVDGPDFAAALGLQISVFAKAGVDKAELHLNPAEMGPVSVSISLDGTSARVEFGADLAATRQAIEAGLPELASSLRDAGFTLTGGGVSDQASQSQQQPPQQTTDPDGARRGGLAGRAVANEHSPVGEAVRRAVARAAAGGVDLYA